ADVFSVRKFRHQEEGTVTCFLHSTPELNHTAIESSTIFRPRADKVIQRAVAIGETEEVLLKDLPPDFHSAPVSERAVTIRNLYDALAETREVCIAAFRASRGNCVKAASLMGVHRNSVYRLIRKHRLEHLLTL